MKRLLSSRWLAAPLGLLALSCGREPADPPVPRATPIAVIGGFDGPEAVKYDAEQGVFFVSSFGGESDTLDNNGFISRLRADGTVDSLRFIAGGRGGVTLHTPRGMALHGDTLWVADADAVRGFHRRTGAVLAVVDFGGQSPGFLNDVTVGGDGALYITDTGRWRIFRVARGAIETVYADTALGGPNGIFWDSAGNRFLVAPYREGSHLLAWSATGGLDTVSVGLGGRYDGIELIGADSVLVASQTDSSLALFTASGGRPILRLAGRPADIGWNGAERVVAVPYLSRDTVELVRLP